MTDRDVSWAANRILRAIRDGRVNQAYALACALAHYCGR
jgi:hypothetical protein